MWSERLTGFQGLEILGTGMHYVSPTPIENYGGGIFSSGGKMVGGEIMASKRHLCRRKAKG